jgi:hypothetical protein
MTTKKAFVLIFVAASVVSVGAALYVRNKENNG